MATATVKKSRKSRVPGMQLVRQVLQLHKQKKTFAEIAEAVGMQPQPLHQRLQVLREKGRPNGQEDSEGNPIYVPIPIPQLNGEGVSSRANADEMLGILEEFGIDVETEE